MDSTPPRLLHQEDSVANVLLSHGFQITRHTLWTSRPSRRHTITYIGDQSGSSTDVRLDENELVEAILSRSDHQLRHYLRQSKDMRSLNARTVNFALRLATIYGWIDGCKTMLQADVMETLDENHFQKGDLTMLGSLAYTKRLEMMQLWLLRRADFGLPQLQWIGYAEDVFDFHECESLPEFSKGIAYNTSFYLRNLRHEIDLLVRKHGIEYCCDSARSNIPDAHLECMLNALLSKGVKVPQHYWPKRKSLYHKRNCWCSFGRLIFETYENEGFCEISGKHSRCGMEVSCSPLVYFLTQRFGGDHLSKALAERDLTVRWLLSKGANLRETWPGSNTTALHCLGQQSAAYLQELFYFSHPERKPCGKWKPHMELNWDYGAFELLVQEEILDSCECECSISGCDFLTCFWKELLTDSRYEPPFPRYETPFPRICDCFQGANPMEEVKGIATSRIWKRLYEEALADVFLETTIWVDRAAHTLQLRRLIHGYIRLFVFSYLELRHTCCAISRIEHNDDPDYNKQPYPRYSPKEERRIKDEDAPLLKILEELVPMFISQFDAVGGRLLDFVVDVMIPKMREVAKELKEEDKALYAVGRRELGVVVYEEEDDAEQSESGEEEEEQDEVIEEESDGEY